MEKKNISNQIKKRIYNLPINTNIYKKKMNNIIIKNKNLIINFTLFISVINILIVFIEKKIIGDLGILGDAQIYYCAAIKFKQGINPYDFANCFGETTMHYQYSLIALYFFYLLSFFNLETYKIIWLIIEIISFFIIFENSTKIFNLKKNFFNFFIFLFAFGGVSWTGLFSGNISIILYALISISIYELYKKKIINFCLLILIVSFFKPYLLLFLILGLALYKKEFIQYFIYTFIVAIFLNFVSFLIHPENFNNYINVILYSTTKEYYANLGSGVGLIGLLDGLLKSLSFENKDLIISKIFWFFSTIIFLLTYISNSEKDKRLNLAYGILITNLLNPYLMNYDFYILIPSLIFLIKKNIFFENIKLNKIFYYSSLIYVITIHDKFACLFLSSLFLFFIIKNNFLKKEL